MPNTASYKDDQKYPILLKERNRLLLGDPAIYEEYLVVADKGDWSEIVNAPFLTGSKQILMEFINSGEFARYIHGDYECEQALFSSFKLLPTAYNSEEPGYGVA